MTLPRSPSALFPVTVLALALALALAAAVLLAPAAMAEKADRSKPMVIEADRDGVMDEQRQTTVFTGNAVVTQGTMLLRAERIEVREQPDGYRAATAVGSRAKPATWRQRRDGVDETVEGNAERIEFDGRTDSVRFTGNATIRRLRGTAVADEINGGVIVWDNLAEVFKVEGGATSAANPGGRVRVVLSPRPDSAASAASAPPSSPSSAASSAPRAPSGTLAPVRSLGEKR